MFTVEEIANSNGIFPNQTISVTHDANTHVIRRNSLVTTPTVRKNFPLNYGGKFIQFTTMMIQTIRRGYSLVITKPRTCIFPPIPTWTLIHLDGL